MMDQKDLLVHLRGQLWTLRQKRQQTMDRGRCSKELDRQIEKLQTEKSRVELEVESLPEVSTESE